MNLAGRSRGNLLGREGCDWKQGKDEGNYESFGKTPLDSHSKRVIGRSSQVGI
jgi:hypothetical protein